ncbi:aldehyde dehydrogenase family protein [Nocardioides sp.]|uniref:aldehyde dehydrogenase family protein n=1 Tax=Nocardioides sp. TaxID=35761 RepID=UPI00263563F8|nr:aldehyde dehydrogenase family protein [Nocardioides sp.]MDI6912250.1 aldehyde dehydrogenase family protein [Nocardioides sp.]
MSESFVRAEVAGVVERARSGQRSLGALSVVERLVHLRALRRAIAGRVDEIVERVQAETGKSRSDILMSEIFGAMDAIAWLEANAVDALADEKVPTPMTLMGKKSRIWFQPRGVVLVVSPWNYPFFQALVPIASALAAGNAVVYKPSEHTPLEGLVESLAEQAAIAPHWLQVVYGDGSVGSEVIGQRPDQVMFTGSARTGRAILRQAAELLIPVELELGGKDPMIVFDDVDIARTAAGAAFGALTAAGQSCTSVERLFVHESIHDDLVAALVELVSSLRLVESPDDDRDGDGDIGRMTTDFQVRTVAEHVLDARTRGARVLTGADWDPQAVLDGRPGLPGRPFRLVPPMVVTDLPDDALMATEETFGPVVPVLRFSDEQEVIRRANASAYGLTASVWSADAERAERVARQLRCGGVSINNVMATEATPALPFGGVGESGMGRYKGVAGLRTFTNAQAVVIDSDGTKLEANWYPYTARKHALFTSMMRAWFSDGPTRLARFAVAGARLERHAQKARRE